MFLSFSCWLTRLYASVVIAAMLVFRLGSSFLTASSGFTARMHSTRGATRIIIDTDMGFDDIVALRILSSMQTIDIQLITSVCGISSANFAARCAKHLVPHAAVTEGMDRGGCLVGSNSWLPGYRQKLNTFANEQLFGSGGGEGGSASGPRRSTDMVESIESALSCQPDAAVDLLCLGPLTNVAIWLSFPRLAGLMERKIRSVWIMGGNLPSKGMGGAEFNFQQDPQAAADVFTSASLSGKLRLVTKDISGKNSGGLPGIIADTATAASKDSGSKFFSSLLGAEPDAVYYDPVCAFAMTNPEHAHLSFPKSSVDPVSGEVTEDSRKVRIQTEYRIPAFVSVVDEHEYEDWLINAIKADAAFGSNVRVCLLP